MINSPLYAVSSFAIRDKFASLVFGGLESLYVITDPPNFTIVRGFNCITYNQVVGRAYGRCFSQEHEFVTHKTSFLSGSDLEALDTSPTLRDS